MPLVDEVADWIGARKLLANLPRAGELRRRKPAQAARVLRMRCDRSLPFEFIAEFLDPWLSLWGARHELSLSDYDPALPQLESAPPADLRILFLDWRLNNLAPAEAAKWVADRAAAALRGSPAVLLNNWPGAPELAAQLAALKLPGLHLIDLEALRAQLPGDFFDGRNDAVSRFPFSSAAAVAIARHLALDLCPALLGERIKGVILDLDDTLWRGVLGEDGPRGVAIGSGHQELHRRLKELRSRGVMLALCSRNDLADVEETFSLRSDLGLSLDDFASVQVNWLPKVDNIAAIAQDLNVHATALLFVDDNASELAKTRGTVEGLRVLLADPDGAETARALDHFPGLFAVAHDDAAGLRTGDVRANREREKLRASAGDLTSYLAALKMEVGLHRNRREDAPRIHELSQKTNQFNLALARLSAAQAAEVLGPDHLTMTVSLRDALADSGLVGALTARLEGELASVREVLFSCRVLGRDVETLSLLHFCRWLEERGIRRVRFAIAEGPRNQPARAWIQRSLPAGPEASLGELRSRLEELCRAHPAAVKEHHDA
jgi:FkbH-like protein